MKGTLQKYIKRLDLHLIWQNLPSKRISVHASGLEGPPRALSGYLENVKHSSYDNLIFILQLSYHHLIVSLQ